MLPRVKLGQQSIELAVVFAQGLHHLHRGDVQLGQAPAVVGHLLQEIGGWAAGGRQACRCARRDQRERLELPWIARPGRLRSVQAAPQCGIEARQVLFDELGKAPQLPRRRLAEHAGVMRGMRLCQ